MKKMNVKWLVAAALACVVGLFASCTFVRPDWDSTDFPADSTKYRILGRVSIEGINTENGYMKLLEAAQKKYPDCDDVVNVVVDQRSTFFQRVFAPFTGGGNYNLSGVAIDYTDF